MSKYFYWISKFDKIIPTCSEDKNNIQIQFPASEKFPPGWMHDLLRTQNFLTLPCRFFSKILPPPLPPPTHYFGSISVTKIHLKKDTTPFYWISPHIWNFVFLVCYWLHIIHLIFRGFWALMTLEKVFVCSSRLVWLVSTITKGFSWQSWRVPTLFWVGITFIMFRERDFITLLKSKRM